MARRTRGEVAVNPFGPLCKVVSVGHDKFDLIRGRRRGLLDRRLWVSDIVEMTKSEGGFVTEKAIL